MHFFTYKVTIHSGGLKSPTRALERQQNSHLTSSQKTDQQECTLDYDICSIIVFLHGPAGQIRPRTLAGGYRGTEPSTPSSPERSGVSDNKKTECLWTSYCIEELIDALVHILNIESWWFMKHTSYFSSAQSIQCSLLGYCLLRRLKRFLIANYRRLKKKQSCN